MLFWYQLIAPDSKRIEESIKDIQNKSDGKKMEVSDRYSLSYPLALIERGIDHQNSVTISRSC